MEIGSDDFPFLFFFFLLLLLFCPDGASIVRLLPPRTDGYKLTRRSRRRDTVEVNYPVDALNEKKKKEKFHLTAQSRGKT